MPISIPRTCLWFVEPLLPLYMLSYDLVYDVTWHDGHEDLRTKSALLMDD